MEAGEIALMNNAAQSEADCDNYEKAMLAESLGAGAIIFSGTMAPSRVFRAPLPAKSATPGNFETKIGFPCKFTFVWL